MIYVQESLEPFQGAWQIPAQGIGKISAQGCFKKLTGYQYLHRIPAQTRITGSLRKDP